jgi:hypothetical protein
MKVLVSGGSGMVGSAVLAALRADGHAAGRLVRPGTAPAAGDAVWDPAGGATDAAELEGADAIVHLAGANIGQGRWTAARKNLLRASRVDATRSLVETLSRLWQKPKIFVAASAVGYYGDRGEELLTESSPPGSDFLSSLACDWEKESLRAGEVGARAVALRFGVILSPAGGALARMLLPFKLGAGGRLGSGRQWMSWLSLPEAVSILRFALASETLSGAVNAVSPQAVRNAEFTRVLARVLRRPAIFPAPAFALKLVLGEMAEALLLAGQRVHPEKLLAAGYTFQHPELEQALRAVL